MTVKFLIDAQLPARLATRLTELGHDAVHVSALPDGNRTTDTEISRVADVQERVVVTKDRDFRDSHLISGIPRTLVLVTTGNITNARLLTLFEDHITAVAELLDSSVFIEVSHDRLVVHSTPRCD
ncbi:DUF5615 family PIN-like protein [Gordonia sp. (in: high G+C Gram-positive bacteria)]|uniref:DUF5615 family PIN-like protein n=1 Tax=Gordonia sp. (in: high G+C Gram-positive bacteria) TaxID=84139 RepID=UPI0025C1A465|nr:DUF5615 family PIN-like protein [Gordonia sp. (in: high G+C Gram-positive bacteria)]HQV17542.1 DUF5615 family PIN-like protein [Gordonia sp. (in: high G+C Gram-positive bacteria)]